MDNDSSRILKEIDQSDSFKKMAELDKQNEAKWEKEIASLENRVVTETATIDIGNGTTIDIRLCLLDSESKRLDELDKESKLLGDAPENEEKKAEMVCEMIEIITANPLITKKWLMENRDKYSPTDVLAILFGYREVRLQERLSKIKRIKSAIDFR